MEAEFPEKGMELTHILVVSDMDKAIQFYTNILGASVYREYGGTSCVLKFLGTWLLLVTGGEPTKDKPDITFAEPQDNKMVSHAMTIRVEDCIRSYNVLKERGAEFITAPVDWGQEIRCFFRDPDGHLFEISQAK